MYASLDMDCNSILQTLLNINKVINMHTWVVIHVMSNMKWVFCHSSLVNSTHEIVYDHLVDARSQNGN
jgi:hypothetical protein